MRKILLATCLMAGLTALAQTAQFKFFKYEGKDARFDMPIDRSCQYLNPVVSGYYPDPSVCRVGDSYYLVNSTFGYFPGVPIFKSNDLVNWQQIGHVLDRESQLNLKGADISQGGIYAPQISYNPKNKTYYMTTMNMTTYQVFYCKSKNPEEGWSEPIQMRHGGMDTSFFFDTDGKAYVVYNKRPMNGQQYEGQMAIHMNEFDWKADSVKWETHELTTGSKCIDQPTCIEGPHLFKVGKYYYLMCAEQGTGFTHSEVIFRSKSPYGPWEDCPHNPILTQRDLTDDNRPDGVTCTGHASMVQAADGQWWAVFLGCRPYKIDRTVWEPDYYNCGRETFLLPVTWKDGWPTILQQGEAVPTVVEKKGLLSIDNNHVTGNFCFTDHFDAPKLNDCWVFLRNPRMSDYDWSNEGIRLNPTPTNLRESESPTALFYRQKNLAFSAETEVTFTPQQEQDLAGLAVFQNEKHHFVIGKTLLDGRPVIVLFRTADGQSTMVATTPLKTDDSIRLKVEGDGRFYSFFFAIGHGDWQTLAQGCDGEILSTHVAGGFVGTTIGLYATTNK